MPIALNTDKAAELLETPTGFGLSLMMIAESVFTPEVLYGEDGNSLDPLTLVDTLRERLQLQAVHPTALNRIQAGITLRTSHAFEQEPLAFAGVCLALYDGYLGDLVTGEMEDLDADEATWGLFEAACIDPQLGEPSPEVVRVLMQSMSQPEDPEAGEPDDEFTPRVQQLHQQLQDLGVPLDVIDSILERGFNVLQHASAEEATTAQAV
jgi:hypothetical protein